MSEEEKATLPVIQSEQEDSEKEESSIQDSRVTSSADKALEELHKSAEKDDRKSSEDESTVKTCSPESFTERPQDNPVHQPEGTSLKEESSNQDSRATSTTAKAPEELHKSPEKDGRKSSEHESSVKTCSPEGFTERPPDKLVHQPEGTSSLKDTAGVQSSTTAEGVCPPSKARKSFSSSSTPRSSENVGKHVSPDQTSPRTPEKPHQRRPPMALPKPSPKRRQSPGTPTDTEELSTKRRFQSSIKKISAEKYSEDKKPQDKSSMKTPEKEKSEDESSVETRPLPKARKSFPKPQTPEPSGSVDWMCGHKSPNQTSPRTHEKSQSLKKTGKVSHTSPKASPYRGTFTSYLQKALKKYKSPKRDYGESKAASSGKASALEQERSQEVPMDGQEDTRTVIPGQEGSSTVPPTQEDYFTRFQRFVKHETRPQEDSYTQLIRFLEREFNPEPLRHEDHATKVRRYLEREEESLRRHLERIAAVPPIPEDVNSGLQRYLERLYCGYAQSVLNTPSCGPEEEAGADTPLVDRGSPEPRKSPTGNTFEPEPSRQELAYLLEPAEYSTSNDFEPQPSTSRQGMADLLEPAEYSTGNDFEPQPSTSRQGIAEFLTGKSPLKRSAEPLKVTPRAKKSFRPKSYSLDFQPSSEKLSRVKISPKSGFSGQATAAEDCRREQLQANFPLQSSQADSAVRIAPPLASGVSSSQDKSKTDIESKSVPAGEQRTFFLLQSDNRWECGILETVSWKKLMDLEIRTRRKIDLTSYLLVRAVLPQDKEYVLVSREALTILDTKRPGTEGHPRSKGHPESAETAPRESSEGSILQPQSSTSSSEKSGVPAGEQKTFYLLQSDNRWEYGILDTARWEKLLTSTVKHPIRAIDLRSNLLVRAVLPQDKKYVLVTREAPTILAFKKPGSEGQPGSKEHPESAEHSRVDEQLLIKKHSRFVGEPRVEEQSVADDDAKKTFADKQSPAEELQDDIREQKTSHPEIILDTDQKYESAEFCSKQKTTKDVQRPGSVDSSCEKFKVTLVVDATVDDKLSSNLVSLNERGEQFVSSNCDVIVLSKERTDDDARNPSTNNGEFENIDLYDRNQQVDVRDLLIDLGIDEENVRFFLRQDIDDMIETTNSYW